MSHAARRWYRCCWLLPLAVALSGCTQQLPVTYGVNGGLDGASVNGTSILAEMYERAGHPVTNKRRLSIKGLREVNTIVWFPDDGNPPKDQVLDFLEDWLHASPNRTLVYVERHYDGGVEYFRRMIPRVQGQAKIDYQRELREAQQRYESRILTGASKDSRWITVDRKTATPITGPLTGPWADGVDPKKPTATLIARARLGDSVKDIAEPLLQLDKRFLAARVPIGPDRLDRGEINSDDVVEAEARLQRRSELVPDLKNFKEREPCESQLILIANGSWLLNLPLTNSANRQLASRLVAASSPGDVVFLESGPGGPPIREQDPKPPQLNLLEILSIWPIGVVLLQLAVAGIVFCFSRLPLFGLPRDPPAESMADFSKHVTALGVMLYQTRDSHFARQKISAYHKSTTTSVARTIATRSGRVEAAPAASAAAPPETTEQTPS